MKMTHFYSTTLWMLILASLMTINLPINRDGESLEELTKLNTAELGIKESASEGEELFTSFQTCGTPQLIATTTNPVAKLEMNAQFLVFGNSNEIQSYDLEGSSLSSVLAGFAGGDVADFALEIDVQGGPFQLTGMSYIRFDNSAAAYRFSDIGRLDQLNSVSSTSDDINNISSFNDNLVIDQDKGSVWSEYDASTSTMEIKRRSSSFSVVTVIKSFTGVTAYYNPHLQINRNYITFRGPNNNFYYYDFSTQTLNTINMNDGISTTDVTNLKLGGDRLLYLAEIDGDKELGYFTLSDPTLPKTVLDSGSELVSAEISLNGQSIAYLITTNNGNDLKFVNPLLEEQGFIISYIDFYDEGNNLYFSELVMDDNFIFWKASNSGNTRADLIAISLKTLVEYRILEDFLDLGEISNLALNSGRFAYTFTGFEVYLVDCLEDLTFASIPANFRVTADRSLAYVDVAVNDHIGDVKFELEWDNIFFEDDWDNEDEDLNLDKDNNGRLEVELPQQNIGDEGSTFRVLAIQELSGIERTIIGDQLVTLSYDPQFIDYVPPVVHTSDLEWVTCSNTEASFTIEASSSIGENLSFQWQAAERPFFAFDEREWQDIAVGANSINGYALGDLDVVSIISDPNCNSNCQTTITINVDDINLTMIDFRIIISDNGGATESDLIDLIIPFRRLFNKNLSQSMVGPATIISTQGYSSNEAGGTTYDLIWETSSDMGNTWQDPTAASNVNASNVCFDPNNEGSCNPQIIFNPPPTQQQYGRQYRLITKATYKGVSCYDTSNVFTLINPNAPDPIITSQPADQTACQDDEVTFSITAEAGKGGDLSIEWQTGKPGSFFDIESDNPANNFKGITTIVTNCNNGSCTSTMTLPLNSGAFTKSIFRAVVTETVNGISAVVGSNEITPVIPRALVQTQPQNAVVAEGQNATFSADILFNEAFEADPSRSFNFTWEESSDGNSWSTVSGGESNDCAGNAESCTTTLTVSNVPANKSGQQYRLQASETVNGVTCTNTSEVVTLTVPKTTITNQPQNVSIEEGQSATFTADLSFNAFGASGRTTSIKWQESTNGSTWTDVVGGESNDCSSNAACTSTLTLSDVLLSKNGTQYRIVASETVSGVTSTVESNQATLTVNSGAAPSITSNPENETICTGSNAEFSVTAAPTRAGTLSFQWESKPNSGSSWSNVSTGVNSTATTSTLSLTSPTANTSGTEYRVIVTENANSTDKTATSTAATLRILDPSITSQPANAEECEGDDATFSVTASANAGGTLEYQWQEKASGGSFTDIDGATSSTLTLADITADMDGNEYKVIVTESLNNVDCTVESQVVNLTVNTVTANAPMATICPTTPGGSTAIVNLNNFNSQINNAATITWYDGDPDGEGSEISNPTLVELPLTSNNLYAKVDDGTCSKAIAINGLVIGDIENPVAKCKTTGLSFDLGSDGTFTLEVADIDNGSSDNCGIKTLALSKTAFTCDDIGSQSVTLTATDYFDKIHSCDATITINTATTLSIDDVSLEEGNSNTTNFTFTVTRGGFDCGDFMVDYTVSPTGSNAASVGVDYQASNLSGTLSFTENGASTKEITVVVIGDDVIESNETFQVVLSNPNPANKVNIIKDTGLGTILNDDSPVISVGLQNFSTTISPLKTSVIEQTSNFYLGFVLSSNEYTGSISFNYSIEVGTAENPDDFTYTSQTGSITFTGGDIREVGHQIMIKGDNIVEGDETIKVIISNLNGAATAAEEYLITIADDDTAEIDFASGSLVKTEDGSQGNIEVGLTMSNPSEEAVTVSFDFLSTLINSAREGFDFEAFDDKTVTFQPLETESTILIDIIDDEVTENRQTQRVQLQSILSGNDHDRISIAQSTGSNVYKQFQINDDDEAIISLQAFDATEGTNANTRVNGSFQFISDRQLEFTLTVFYTVSGTATIDVDFSSSPTNAFSTSKFFSISAGNQSDNISVLPLKDTNIEGDETIIITLNTEGANELISFDNEVATLVIRDDDFPIMKVGNAVKTERIDTENMVFTVTLEDEDGKLVSHPDGVTVEYATSDGTATAGIDYTATMGTLNIPSDETSGTIEVPILNDKILEIVSPETLTLTLNNPDNAIFEADASSITATGSITNMTFGFVGIEEMTDGEEGNLGSDGAFKIKLVNENGEPVISEAVITVEYSVVDENSTATTDTDFTIDSSVDIPIGDSEATITVSTLQDNLVEATEILQVEITSVSGHDNIRKGDDSFAPVDLEIVASINILDNDFTTVTVTPSDADAAEADPSNDGEYTFNLTNPIEGDYTLNFTLSGTATDVEDFTEIGSSITIPNGETEVILPIAIIDDMDTEPLEDLILTIDEIIVSSGERDIRRGTPNNATITIVDNEEVTMSVVASPSADEGNSGTKDFTFQVGLSQVSANGPVTVSYSFANSTAEFGTDYTLPLGFAETGSLTFDPAAVDGSANSQTITVTVQGDKLVELNETLVLVLSNLSDNAVFSNDEETLSDQTDILNDDAATISIAKATDGDGAEGTSIDNGAFEVSLDNPSSVALDVTISVFGGSATETEDYIVKSKTVTIPAGSTDPLSIDVSVVQDMLVEGTEDVIVQLNNFELLNGTDPDVTSSISIGMEDDGMSGMRNHTAGLDISDDDEAIVRIEAEKTVNPEGNTSPQQVSLNVTLSGEVPGGFTLSYGTVDGTAIAGTDFTAVTAPTGNDFNLSFDGTDGEVETITIDILSDTDIEGNESFTVQLSNVNAGGKDVSIQNGTATVTIIDDDEPTVNVEALSNVVTEGAQGITTTYDFKISLTQAPNNDVTLKYKTQGAASGNMATVGTDYIAVSETDLTLNAGKLSETVSVTINGDNLIEPDEVFDFVISNVSGASIGTTTATGIIEDDDIGKVRIAGTNGTENTTDGLFTVSLVNESGDPITSSTDTKIEYSVQTSTSPQATETSDYASLSGMITIDAGNSSASITVSLANDDIVEATEYLKLLLDDLVENMHDGDIMIDTDNDEAEISIADDDIATVSIAATDDDAAETEDNESANTATYTITINKQIASDVTVNFSVDTGNSTADETDDFTINPAESVVFTADETATEPGRSKIITLTPVNDPDLEGQETATVLLGIIENSFEDGSILKGTSSATVNIADNEANGLSVVDVEVDEGNTGEDKTMTFTVSLADVPESTVTVPYSITAGTATLTDDFVADAPLTGTLTFDPTNDNVTARTQQTVSITIKGDDLVESPTETINFMLSSPDGPAELSDPTAVGTINENDAATISFSNTVSATEGSTASPGTIELKLTLDKAVDNGFSISYTLQADGTASEGDFTNAPQAINFTGGANEMQTIQIPIIGDDLVEADETFTISVLSNSIDYSTISNSNGIGGSTATATIEDDDDAQITVSTVNGDEEGLTPGSFTFSLTKPVDVELSVPYTINASGTDGATNGTDYTMINNGTITFAANSTSSSPASISVAVQDDLLPEGTENVTLTLGDVSISGGVVRSLTKASDVATVNILDNEALTLSVAAEDFAEEEAKTADEMCFTLQFNRKPEEDVSLQYRFEHVSTAAADFSDKFFDTNQALTIAPTDLDGQNRTTICLNIEDDDLIEETETFKLILTRANDANFDFPEEGTTLESIGTITDSDAGKVRIAASPTSGEEGGSNGEFTIELVDEAGTAITSSTDTKVAFSLVTGTTPAAIEGNDFTNISEKIVTIVAGTSSKTITITVEDDEIVEFTEYVKIQLDEMVADMHDENIMIDATNNMSEITITDNDQAEVTITVDESDRSEEDGQREATFTIKLSKEVDAAVTVNLDISGSAQEGTDKDYTLSTKTVQFDANSSAGATKSVTLNVIDDDLPEGTETATLTIGTIAASNLDVVAGDPNNTTINIADNDAVVVSLKESATVTEVDEGNTSTLTFTFALSELPAGTVIADYTIQRTGSSATYEEDFDFSGGNPETGTITFDPTNIDQTARTEQTISVTILGDRIIELDEEVEVILSNLRGTGSAVFQGESSTLPAKGTIEDNDSGEVSIAATTDGEEGTTDGEFTVSLVDGDGNAITSFANTKVNYSTTTGSSPVATVGTLGQSGTDYETLSGQVTILKGESTATITVKLEDDEVVEAIEYVQIQLDELVADMHDEDITIDTDSDDAELSISDNDAATVSIEATKTVDDEGDSDSQEVTFKVTLAGDVQDGFTVDYATMDGTAKSGDGDYNAISSTTLDFTGTNGEEIMITVKVNGDTEAEGNEAFTVELSNVQAEGDVSIDNSTGTVNITDDDAALLKIEEVMTVDAEGNSDSQDVTFKVSLVGNAPNAFTVDYATMDGTAKSGDGDYNAISSTRLNFTGTNGEEKMITVKVNGDEIVEEDESFKIVLSNLQGAGSSVLIDNGEGTVNIIDDDAATISIEAAQTLDAEGNSDTKKIDFKVTLKGTVQDGFSVDYATSDGTASSSNDYDEITATSLDFTGSTNEEQTISVIVNGDEVVEINETFTLSLSNVQAGDKNVTIENGKESGTGTITDDDQAEVTISADPTEVSEDDGERVTNFTVTLTKSVDADITVVLNNSGSAEIGNDKDYTLDKNIVTFSKNSAANATQMVKLTVNDDDLPEAIETATIALGDITAADLNVVKGTNNSASVNITDNDIAYLSVSGPETQVEEGTTDDKTTMSFTVSLTPASSQTVTVAYEITGTAAVNSDYDYGDGILKSGTLTFEPDDVSKTIDFMILGDEIVEADETIIVTLSNPVNADFENDGDEEATGTIADEDMATISIQAVALSSEDESESERKFEVTLTGDVDQDITVDFKTVDGEATSEDNDYEAQTDGQLTFESGGLKTLPITVKVTNDEKVELNETFKVELSNIDANGKNVVFDGNQLTIMESANINNDDKATISILDVNLVEGKSGPTSFDFNVTMNAEVDADVVITFSTEDGDGSGNDPATTVDNDYTKQTDEMVTITAGQNSASLTVVVIGDENNENDEEFFVNLTAIMASGREADDNITFANVKAVGTIQNDDFVCPTVPEDMLSGPTSVCNGDNTTSLSVSGLDKMDGVTNGGQDFGIQFVVFANSTNDPYNNGNSLGDPIDYNALTANFRTATLSNVAYPTVPGIYHVYAILSPAPDVESCRPYAVTTVEVYESVADAQNPMNNSYCGNDEVAPLSVDDPGDGYMVEWYSVETGGNPITNATFSGDRNEQITLSAMSAPIAPNVGANITLYAAIRDVVTDCVSKNREAVELIHYPGLTAFEVSIVECFANVLNFDLRGKNDEVAPGATISWYQGDPRTDGILITTPENINLNKLDPNSVGLMSEEGQSIGYIPGTPSGLYSVAENENRCAVVTQHTLYLVNCGISITRNEGDPEIADPCKCKDNATNNENGQFDELVTVLAPAGQTWTVIAVNGLYSTASAAPPAVPIDNLLGTTMQEVPDPDQPLISTYALYGIHVDAIGYSILVSNGTTELSINNLCYYPEVSINNLRAEYCKTAQSVTLTGSAVLGDATNTLITGGTGTFFLFREKDGAQVNTGNTLSLDFSSMQPGDYRVIYTFDAPEDNPDAKHAGCIQVVEKFFTIKNVNCGSFQWSGN